MRIAERRRATAPRPARTVRRTALVAALLAPIAAASCGGGGDGTGPTEVVTAVVVAPDSVDLAPGGTAQLSASVLDADGKPLSGRSVTWSSANPAAVDVSATGLVSAAAVGRAVITARSEGRSGTAVVVVAAPGPLDYAIVGARYTQGVQSADGSIPVVLSGDDVVFDVLLSATAPAALPMRLVLRLTDAAGATVYADTAGLLGPLGAAPDFDHPSAQFLVPVAVVGPGSSWRIERDPDGAFPDGSADDDVYPRDAPAPLAAVAVPALRIRFVPIVLSAHDNTTGRVTTADIPEYLRTAKSILPLGAVEAHLGTPLTTSASFGTGTSGGDAPFWLQVLAELDLARISDPTEPDANWYGIVQPPSSFNFTQYGGFSYIPTSGADAGPNTRTSLSVQIAWFSRPTQARDLVAHELSHTFGRHHAPCGDAGGVDPDYPVAGGTLDVAGEDVYSWSTGRASSAALVPKSTGDVMGYCFPVWASTYTYRGVMAFRGTLQPPVTAAAGGAGPPPGARRAAGEAARSVALAGRTRVLVVRGSVVRGGPLRLLPAFVMTAQPALPERPGPYRLDGLAADGRTLFSYAFAPAAIDHAPGMGHFTLAIPLTPSVEGSLATLRLEGPEGERRLTGSWGGAAARALPAATVSAASAGGVVTAACPAGAAGVVVVRASDGVVLASAAASATAVAGVVAGTPLTVLCSDGVATRRSEVVAP